IPPSPPQPRACMFANVQLFLWILTFLRILRCSRSLKSARTHTESMGQRMGELSGERMPKKINRLSAMRVASTRKPGFYADGDGLYLQVTDTGSRSWVFRFKIGGRTRD